MCRFRVSVMVSVTARQVLVFLLVVAGVGVWVADTGRYMRWIRLSWGSTPRPAPLSWERHF